MAENSAQLLRPVGQKLEELDVDVFAVKVDGDALIISGKKKRIEPPPEEPKGGFWSMFKAGPKVSAAAQAPQSEDFEIRLSQQDIAELDDQGKARRNMTNENTSESHSPSQVLRAVGAYVERKGGTLVAIKKEIQGVTVDYLDKSGQPVTEELPLPSLYEFWVKMYLKRSGRE